LASILNHIPDFAQGIQSGQTLIFRRLSLHFGVPDSIIAVPQALTYQTLSLAMRIESYPDIDIGILVQREQVQERNDHREGPNNEAIACIECQSDAKFAIRFCVKQMNDLEHLGFFYLR
jgi:hypothetical protein